MHTGKNNLCNRVRRGLVLGAAASGLVGCVLAGPQAVAATGAHAIAGSDDQRHDMRCWGGWRLVVPSIGVSAPVITLGGPRSGAIAVPTFGQVWDVGWYRYGAVPGRPGNAVFLGHVDTYRGPAVFYNLYELRYGAEIEANLGCGHVERFYVRWVREVAKTQFPSNEVFGRTRRAQLWLITCGGQFDYATRHYLSNIIVFATR